MIIYYIIILSCFFFSAYKIKKFNNVRLENIFLIVVVLFLSSGLMTGTDWRNYELLYNNINLYNAKTYQKELGFYYLISFFSTIGINFWHFLIALKVLVFFAFYSFTKKINLSIFLFLALYLPESGFYLFIDNPLRNFIAIGIFVYSSKFIYQKRPLPYLACFIVAFTFHISSVIMLPIYFLARVSINKYLIIILFIASNLIAYKELYILKLFDFILSSDTLFSTRFEFYTDSDKIRTYINMGTIVKTVILSFILIYRDKVCKCFEKGKYVINIAIIFFLIYPFTVSVNIFLRANLFLFPFYIAAIIYTLKSIDNAKIVFFFKILIITYALRATYNTISTDSRFTPYSNYFIEVIKNKGLPSYQERSNYNPTHSPFKHKDNNRNI